jgi:phthalate 4,5-dioxygenase oxygenase subunit
MLTQEENELLTRVGPGTPGGEMLRRYWQPAALIDELPAGAPPLPVRLLGEDLVLFRDERGRPGLLGLHCSHRGADLSYGRLEDGGLRCVYHGWLYDVDGRCLEQPGEPEALAGDRAGADGEASASPLAAAPRRFYESIRHRAYPCREFGGLILTYMGPGDPPEVPAYPFLLAPDDCRANSKLFSECSYLQANEGNIDSVHLGFLHSGDPVNRANNRGFDLIEPVETDYGLRIFFVRHEGSDADRLHIRHFVLPNISPGGRNPGGRPDTVNWHVPIDDTHHWKYWITASSEPIDRGAALAGRADLTPDYRLVRNKSNRYLQDRAEMKTQTWSGLGRVFQPHDTCVTEGAGPIQDRTREHAAYTDRGIIAARRQLLGAIKDVREGRDPPHVVRDPARNDFSHMAIGGNWLVPRSFDWKNATPNELQAAALPPPRLESGGPALAADGRRTRG